MENKSGGARRILQMENKDQQVVPAGGARRVETYKGKTNTNRWCPQVVPAGLRPIKENKDQQVVPAGGARRVET